MLEYLGSLFLVFGLVLCVPMVLQPFLDRGALPGAPASTFIVPAIVSMAMGFLLKRRRPLRALDARRSMLLCTIAWVVISAVASAPFVIALRVSWLDAFFESVSGFTTTGITMLSGLDDMPRSILFWRSLTQWLGGLGILTFFLVVATAGGSAHRLFSAESHKIFSKRPAPGLLHTLKILWAIYAALTALIIALLLVEGVSAYDAVSHAFTALSTGGYSPYDASIAHYATHPHSRAIEYTIILGMILGGTNFFLHYRFCTGEVSALWTTWRPSSGG